VLKSTAIDHAEQELDRPGGASGPRASDGARRAPGDPPLTRVHRRRRWPFVVVAVIALAALFAPPSGSSVNTASKVDTAPDRSAQMQRAYQLLSTGAPTGAVTLSTAPTHVVGPQVDVTSATSGLAANGIPSVVLNAYRVAATRMDNQSSCGIDWSLLAGIGRVESNHGRYGGATVASDGTSAPRILGPALDGQGFAFIRDTDQGLYDGDTVTDRAVGPMQFIPATWRSYAIDGNGDGVADPFNVYDASLAAAHYLCVAGGNLATDAGQRQAVLAYNHSDSYVNEVLALAHAYAAGIPVSDIPMVGDTSGAVPAPGPTFAYAPANPGPAVGASDYTPANGATVGNDPSATSYPAAQPAGSPSGGGGAPPADTGGPTGGGTPPPAGGDPGVPPGTGGNGSPPAGGPGAGPPTGGGTQLGPVTVPAPQPPAPAPPPPPAPVPAPPPAPVPVLGVNPLTGVKCYIGTVVAPGLLPCPPGTPPL
jgi:hypothetical protein